MIQISGVNRGIFSPLHTARRMFEIRERFSRGRRIPFYELAANYLPKDPQEVVVDLGAGEGLFVQHLGLHNAYRKLFLLDSGQTQVKKLSQKYEHVIRWQAPDPIPFRSQTVAFLHSSHLIEHLNYPDLIRLLAEMDRVLKPCGILVISTPLLWKKFYNDRTHVKPYNPVVIEKILCRQSGYATGKNVSERFRVLELAYRHRRHALLEGEMATDSFWGSEYFMLDFILQTARKLLEKCRIHKYEMTGYTMILQKSLRHV